MANHPLDRLPRAHASWLALVGVAVIITTPIIVSTQQAPDYYDLWPDAVRLLEQSTFGPTPEAVLHVEDVGTDSFLDEQQAAPSNPYPDLPPMPSTRPETCTGTCQRDNYTMYPLQVHFFQNALTGSDQLRQRMAFALGQILVVSSQNSNVRLSSWMGPYQQLLYANALGNFRTLLRAVTLNAAMGSYLNMVNNKQFNAVTGVRPNENFARELLQLFSIGLVILNPDGTPKLGPDGQPVPTYDQAVVEDFSRVFTGWILAPAFGPGIPNYRDPMVVRVARRVEVDHDPGEKQLLNGATVPGGLSASDDLDAALDNIFNHPNVGPFICKQLIQHLVTSNPSPGYVARVVRAFEDNGHGVRGDLAVTVRTILVDDEARGRHTESTYGHLLEPVLFVTRLLRAFNGASDGVLNASTTAMGQNIFGSPSVFNFYPPGYRIVGGNGILGPEFKLFDSASSFARINFVNTIVFGGLAAAPPDRPAGTTIDLSPLLPLAASPGDLILALNGLLLHSTMSPAVYDVIVAAVQTVPATNPLLRVRTAVYLIASSSQYQVER